MFIRKNVVCCDYCYEVIARNVDLYSYHAPYEVYLRGIALHEFCSLHCKISWKGEYPRLLIIARNGQY